MTLTTFLTAPIDLANEREHRRQLADRVNQAISGKFNCLVEVTLTASAATTTISSPLVGTYTVAILVPVTESAGGEVGVYQTHPNTTLGQLVLNHATDSRTDRSFVAVLFG